MATNFVQPGDSLTLTAPSGGVVSGVAYAIASLMVVALSTASAGDSFEGAVDGVFELAADAADTFNEGEAVYWDAGNTRVTVVSTGNVRLGHAVEDKATPTVVKCRLQQLV